jgi:L-ascorbate metabolism protein UlaG (beta-lactamase superfamily)
VIAAFVLAAAVATGTGAVPLRATFIGNMAFAITDGKTTLYTDFPYQSGYAGYMTYDFASVPKAPGALCLVTHGHLDHFDPSLFAKMDAKLIAPPSVEARVASDRSIPFAPRMHFRVLEIEALTTPHGNVEHASYLVTWHGRRLYFTGDTDSVDPLLAMKDLDYAFVSPWLLGMVAERKGRIDARTVVCYHHTPAETVPPVQNRIVPKPGETLTLEAAAVSTANSPR